MFVKVKTFDGKAVKWEGANANNSGHVKIPAGKHDIVFDWTMQQTQMTGVSSTTYTYETTTKSLKDITISPVFEAGHNYFIGGGQLADGSLKIYLQDMTNMPNEFYGDVVANAPKASKSPTEFEGAWKDNEGTTFVFAGNTWEQALPPGTSTNTGAQEVRLKGTFESANGKVTLYMTDTFAAGKWIKMTAMKSAYIYDYSFEGGDLLLELGGVLPKSRYIKQ
jgi:N-acetylneuraminic acid mutarotase